MASQDIVEGLKIATAKGESLQKAMTSFYNAGYEKFEIEEAARIFQGKSPSITMQTLPQTNLQPKPIFPTSPQIPQIKKVFAPPGNTIQKVSNYLPQKPIVQQETNKANVSDYSAPPTMQNKLLIVFLIIALILLVGSLLGAFIFKDEILSFFSSLFS